MSSKSYQIKRSTGSIDTVEGGRDLKVMARDGRLKETDHVRVAGGSKWYLAGTVDGLKFGDDSSGGSSEAGNSSSSEGMPVRPTVGLNRKERIAPAKEMKRSEVAEGAGRSSKDVVGGEKCSERPIAGDVSRLDAMNTKVAALVDHPSRGDSENASDIAIVSAVDPDDSSVSDQNLIEDDSVDHPSRGDSENASDITIDSAVGPDDSSVSNQNLIEAASVDHPSRGDSGNASDIAIDSDIGSAESTVSNQSSIDDGSRGKVVGAEATRGLSWSIGDVTSAVSDSPFQDKDDELDRLIADLPDIGHREVDS